MSLERCLELIEQRHDREQDSETLIEELADLESAAVDAESTDKYLSVLNDFLIRADELLSEEEVKDNLLSAAISNLRSDLEGLKRGRAPTDPLEHLFLDMTRFESGTIPASTALSTLSRYETLLLALRDQFEHSTDPTDERKMASMMRKALDSLESAGKRLRQDLENGLDYAFDELKEEFREGTRLLMKFRGEAKFENEHGEEL